MNYDPPLPTVTSRVVEERRPRFFLKITMFRALTWISIILFAAVKLRLSERLESRIDIVAAAVLTYVSLIPAVCMRTECRV